MSKKQKPGPCPEYSQLVRQLEEAKQQMLQWRSRARLAEKRIKQLTDSNATRRFPWNTCVASRHAQMIGDGLLEGSLVLEGHDCGHIGQSIHTTVRCLFAARDRLKAIEDAQNFVDNTAAGLKLASSPEQIQHSQRDLQEAEARLLSLTTRASDAGYAPFKTEHEEQKQS